MKRYDYETRVMVVFTNGTRASYSRKRYGETLERVVELSMSLDQKVFNYYEIDGDILKVFYWDQAKKKEKVFITDTSFLEEVVKRYWATNSNGYVHTTTGTEQNRPLYLHWLVLDFSREDRENTGLVTDHINHDIKDNRLKNLRLVTNRQNSTNQQGQHDMGVNRINDGWRARWSHNGEDFSKSFYGEGAYERARRYRNKKVVETGYLLTFNDYPERE